LTAKIKSYTVVSAYNSLCFGEKRSGMGSMDNSNEGKDLRRISPKGEGGEVLSAAMGAPAERL